MNESYLIQAIIPVTKAFEELNVIYYITGSVASSAYGKARATMDVDVVTDLTQDKVSLFVEMLKENYYIDEEAIRHAIDQNSSFNLIHFETMFKVDVFIAQKKLYDQGALKRRRKDSIDENQSVPQIYLGTVEDIVLSKIDWFQKGGNKSDKQWDDILGILKVQKERLDLNYLKHWAKELGLLDLLNKALIEI